MAMHPVNEQFADVGDVTLCYETFGDQADEPLLLIMGLGTQMLGWPADFCAQLAARGFFVIRYDNRDVGRSTKLSDHRPPSLRELLTRRPKRVAYTLEDMAEDARGLLDHLGIDSAHVAGASMGAMIAHVLAGRHPERVRSLASIMSTTGNRRVGRPALRTYAVLAARPGRGKDAYVEQVVKVVKAIGSPGFERDEDELREMAALSYDRGASRAGVARQLAAIQAAGDRTPDVRRIQAPTLVIHGTKDRLIDVSGGKATHKAIEGSRLMLVEGMGHELPRGAWDRIVDGVAGNARLAAGAQEPERATR